MTRRYPPLRVRLASVWYRHMRVYTRSLLANGLPPFLEPLIFLAGIGLGLGVVIETMEGKPYLSWLAAGLAATSAMFTAAFECSFGTYIRLEFERIYDGMLAAPMTHVDLMVGEILWAGTKGFFFSFCVTSVMAVFGILAPWAILLTPLLGFFTGMMFATLSLLMTSFVKDINQFNFYFTGLLSPMFFFGGVVFSLEQLPGYLRPVIEALPLTHSVRIARALCFLEWRPVLAADALYIALFTVLVGALAVKRLKKKLVS